jgi:hypothetical protein
MGKPFQESRTDLSRKILELVSAFEAEYGETLTPIEVIRDESGELQDLVFASDEDYSRRNISLGERMVGVQKHFIGTEAAYLIKEFERKHGVS